ncbi:hypothetical protein [Larkinella humicola]|uniref:Uncharacterized protein n=1 Tax=Larkinella humicola TaxID=2607654 RepID=A0A5N1J991_9BACT|nr:hypothetical protein [Larkinella humicola]KAA9349222.1 hypothetical protein F0P93_22770 [Larkinella humicola]
MKSYWIAISLLGLLACGGGSSGTADIDSGGGARHASNTLGRQVSGTRLLSEYYKYNMPCYYMGGASLKSMFNLEEDAPLIWKETESTCEVVLNNKKLVVLSTTTDRPFESVFHADYYFNRLYQPEALDRRGRKQPYTGPEPQGAGAESPVGGVGNNSSAGNSSVAGAPNDSIQVNAAPGQLASAQLKDSDEQQAGPQPVPGVWEKAVWDAKSRTLHILNLQHVFHITVNHGPTAKMDSLNATKLGALLTKQVDDEANQGEAPIY